MKATTRSWSKFDENGMIDISVDKEMLEVIVKEMKKRARESFEADDAEDAHDYVFEWQVLKEKLKDAEKNDE